MSHHIHIEKVSKIYNMGKADEMKALKSITLSIDRGEVAVLTGPSGSGKTSLLSLMGCMSRPTEGKIGVDGKDIVKLPERFLTEIRRKKYGFIFQQFHLIRELSVMDNILLPLYPLNIPPGKMKAMASPILSQLKIDKKHKIKVKHLSGGEQQRVAIARALINNPQIIIADEPTAHLDRKLASEFMDTLILLNQKGKTIVIASHDPFIYDNDLITKSIVLQDGQISAVKSR